MRIYLIRHAEPSRFRDGITEKGRIEAEALSRRMEGIPVKDFYVSPLVRAQETAAPTLRRLNRTAETLPWLEEFHGMYTDPETGETRRVAWDLMPKTWTAIPGIMHYETWLEDPLFDRGNIRQVWKETTDGVDELLGRYGYRKDGPVWRCGRNIPDTIACFCHFGISMAVLGYLLEISPMLLWHRAVTLPSSLTEIRTEERVPGEVSFRLVRLGDLAHLENAGEPESTAALYPEVYTGIDSTYPYENGTLQRFGRAGKTE